MTSGDIATVVSTLGGAFTAVVGGVVLLRRRSGQLSAAEQDEAEACASRNRLYLRIIRLLRDVLAAAGVDEPEGLDERLAAARATGGRRTKADAA